MDGQAFPVKPAKKSGKLKRTLLTKVLPVFVLLALAGGAAGYFAYKYDQSQKDVQRLSNPQESARQEADELVAKVSLLVELPAGETPTVATVSDASKLKDQAFFAKSENGDRVLIYTEARRAILYRPSTNKIIEIAPVNIGTTPTTGTGTTTN